MTTTAVVIGDGNGAAQRLDRVVDRCRRERLDVRRCDGLPEAEEIPAILGNEPCVVFLPAVEADCLGVKLSQVAQACGASRVICLYAPALPGGEYLCLAFREGVDDVIALDASDEAVGVQVARAARLLQDRIAAAPRGAEARWAERCEQFQRRAEKMKERLLALASAAGRIVTGELNLATEVPRALIVSASRSQAGSAAQLAERLGFETTVCETGAEAVAEAKERPPRVVLADSSVPDRDLPALAREIRAALGRTPVVIAAWSSSEKVERQVLVPGSGIDDFVPKSTTGEGRHLLAAAFLGALR